jgi:hypothetical protein
MFLPAILLFLGGLILNQFGHKGYKIYILSGLLFVFGVVVLWTG